MEDVVRKGQALNVPLARYNEPSDLLASEQLRMRNVFEKLEMPTLGEVPAFTAPFQLDGAPLQLQRAAVEPGLDNEAVWCAWLGHTRADLDRWARHGTV